MARYILLYNGKGLKPAPDVEQIRSTSGVKVLDEASRMLLVEGRAAELKRVLDELTSWSMTTEKLYRVCPPKAQIKKAAHG
jgi:hypothetical protein